MNGFTHRVDNILKKRHTEQRQRRFERCLEETPAGNPVVKDSSQVSTWPIFMGNLPPRMGDSTPEHLNAEQ